MILCLESLHHELTETVPDPSVSQYVVSKGALTTKIMLRA